MSILYVAFGVKDPVLLLECNGEKTASLTRAFVLIKELPRRESNNLAVLIRGTHYGEGHLAQKVDISMSMIPN